MVKPGFHESGHIGGIGKFSPVGIETCHEPGLLGISNQFRQIRAKGGFSASKDNVGDFQAPNFVQDGLPALGGELRVGANSGVVAMGTIIVAAVSERKVHAIRRA